MSIRSTLLQRRAAEPERADAAPMPPAIADFLAARRIAVAGVSRSRDQAANAVFRKLRDCGYDVVPVNPKATEVEGRACHPDIASIPGAVDALMVVTPPGTAAALVRDAAAHGIRRIWFHRSFGEGSVSPEAVQACVEAGIEPIVGGCPLMYLAPVDVAHRCMRTWLRWRHRMPG